MTRTTTWRNEVSDLRPMSALRMLVDAAKRSHCRIKEFMFLVPDEEEFVELESNINLAIATAGDVFAELMSFKIEFRSAGAEQITKDLAKVLPLAKSISNLGLIVRSFVDAKEIFYNISSSRQIANILGSVSSDTLRRVKLEKLFCEQEDLRRFLEGHNSTIKELSFMNVVVIGAWDELLEWIGANLRLQRLELKLLGTMDADDTDDWSDKQWPVNWRCHFVLQGVDEVRLGLIEVLENKRREDEKCTQEAEETQA